MQEELLTNVELAEKLKVSSTTITEWRRSGIIPHIKIGGTYRYSWKAVFTKLQSDQLRSEFRSSPELRKLLRLTSNDPDSDEWKRKEENYVQFNLPKFI